MKISTRLTFKVAILTMAVASSSVGQELPTGNYSDGQGSTRPSSYRSYHSPERRNEYELPYSGGDLVSQASSDFPDLPTTFSELGSRRGANSGRVPADPFRRLEQTRTDDFSETGTQVRYRLPSGGSNPGDAAVPRRMRSRSGYDPGSVRPDDFSAEPLPERTDESRPVRQDSRDAYESVPVPEYGGERYVPREGQDPFVPAPLPELQRDNESSAIDELLTIRYQNPVTVRAIRAMSSNQALQLFSEVSQKIDERSLEPTSYDVRVRRGLRNLTLALDNQAFVNGLAISPDSFQLDGFRNTLSRLAGGSPVRNYQEARTVLNTVMTAAQSVKGLTPNVVAFEFANASIDTLDKFSGLEPADPSSRNGAQTENVKSASLEEEIVGIGVEVREHPEGLVVVKPLRGGPAAEAGVASGDVILSINDRQLAGMKMAGSVDLMKGSAGSRMKIRIFREGLGERDFLLTRRTVRVWTVNDVKLLSGTDVGYFSLSRFSQNSTAEVDQALNALYEKGMQSLIVDLRGNPGGLLTTCIEISDRFVPCGTIVSTKGRLSSDNLAQEATYSKTWSTPLVVLVDGDSASASEIFAAAVQENRRGAIVGTRSYGKGSVQTHFPLSSIAGDLRLTTALFYSPNGRKMAGEGVRPDVEVHDRDGVLNGDDVLAEAVRVARSQTLKNMAKAAGTCKPRTPSAARSSSLGNIIDPSHRGTAVR